MRTKKGVIFCYRESRFELYFPALGIDMFCYAATLATSTLK